ncbi:MAG: TetR/AcrR family transcriptional regulator [Hyphomicrobiales bacterium]|nr:MAG: TetR/AcrR family transcriptional regulator [Hyphomicrobiales bacterium]
MVQAAELRESFLEAATRSFLDKGYAATSIEAIARESGVAKITIYRQFENKQALFSEVIHRALDQARAGMHAALRGDKTNTEERLLQLIEGMYMGASEPRTLGLLRLVVAEATRFPELAKLVYTENSKVLDPLVHYLHEAHREGKLYVPSPELTAIQLSTLAFGGVRFFISKPLSGPAERRQWAQGVLDLVMYGLRPRSAGPDQHALERESDPSTV